MFSADVFLQDLTQLTTALAPTSLRSKSQSKRENDVRWIYALSTMGDLKIHLLRGIKVKPCHHLPRLYS